jgi:hypothetical protein
MTPTPPPAAMFLFDSTALTRAIHEKARKARSRPEPCRWCPSWSVPPALGHPRAPWT